MKCVQNDAVQRKPPFPCGKGTVLSEGSHGEPVAWETGMKANPEVWGQEVAFTALINPPWLCWGLVCMGWIWSVCAWRARTKLRRTQSWSWIPPVGNFAVFSLPAGGTWPQQGHGFPPSFSPASPCSLLSAKQTELLSPPAQGWTIPAMASQTCGNGPGMLMALSGSAQGAAPLLPGGKDQ